MNVLKPVGFGCHSLELAHEGWYKHSSSRALRRASPAGYPFEPEEIGELETKSGSFLEDYRHRLREVIETLPIEAVSSVIELLQEARQGGRMVFICGNGGSAATASHLANDLGKGASLGRSRRFRVLSLTDNIPWMTALANDLDYSQVFVEQLRNYARPGDVLIAFSGSGQSPNVLEAVRWARAEGLVTIGFSGRKGGQLATLAEYPVLVASDHMGRIEDGHFILQHLVGYYFMEADSSNPE